MGHIVITGSEGFLGRAVCKTLHTGKHCITRFDKKLGLNVTNATDLKDAVEGSDATIHLGAPCTVRMFVERPKESWDETVIGMQNVLKYCSGRIIFPSTCTLYGNSTIPVNEANELPAAPNLYAAAKAECERLCLRAASQGKDVRILRIFTGYGPGETTKGDYASPLIHFIHAAIDGRQPTVFGDGEQVRDLIFVDDVVGFVLAALSTQSNNRVFNVGTGIGTSFLGVIKIIEALTDQRLKPIFCKRPVGYVTSVIANTEKAKEELGYEARVSIEDGIKQTFNALRNTGGKAYSDRQVKNTNFHDTNWGERRITNILNRLPESLVDAVKGRTCIPFVGSGLSLDFGLPTWRELIQSLTKRCKSDIIQNWELIVALQNEGMYLEAVQCAKDKLGKQRYFAVLKKLFSKYQGKAKDGLHPLIWALEPPMVMTTNFDTLLEDSITPKPEVVTYLNQEKLLDIFRGPEGRVLFKVHGTISNVESIVLAANDYNALYTMDMKAFHLAFTQPLLSKTLLFIGFGLIDEGVLKMLKRSAGLFDGFRGDHYALMKRGEASVHKLWSDYGVQVVEYKNHDEIKGILSELSGLIQESKVTHSVAPVTKVVPTVSGSTGRRVVVGPSDAIPENLTEARRRAFGECIVLVYAVEPQKLRVWQHSQVLVHVRPVYYQPTPTLEDVQRTTLANYDRLGYRTSPRLSLVNLQLEPKDSYRHGDITIHAKLTDWALVDGIQTVLAKQQQPYFKEISEQFWVSVESLAAEGRSVEFPHHLAVHCLVISADNKVILNRRAGVSNQRGRVSASFEEQMQSPHMYPGAAGRGPRYFDGDENPVDAVLRGANEELGIKLARDDVVIMAVCMEAASIAANILTMAKTSLTAEEIYNCWRMADDKGENEMVPPTESPIWSLDAIVTALMYDSDTKGISPYGGPWHSSSPARLVLGLAHDFGIDTVGKRVDISFLGERVS